MRYNLYIASPEEVATSIGRCVEKECTLPLEDVLSSPNFDWYPGLCVVAIDSEDNEIVYEGIYNEKECVQSNFIGYWKDQKNGCELLRNIETSMSEESLTRVVIDLCEMISIRMGELSIDHEEFDEGIDFIKRLPNVTKQELLEEISRIEIVRSDIQFNQLSVAVIIENDAFMALKNAIDALFYQATLYIFACQFCRVMNESNVVKESKKLADYIRKTVSFREIALRAVQ